MKIQHLIIYCLSQLLIVGTVSAAPLSGRIFTTPNERASLDFLRQTSKVPSPQELSDDTDAVTIAPSLPSSVSLQGFVRRGDGKKGTVWLNDMPVQENTNTGEVQVGKLPRQGGQVQITIPASGRNVNLKAGQVYIPEADSISEDKARMTSPPEPKAQDAGVIGATPSGQP